MFCDPTQMVQRRAPGKLDSWVAFVVVTACFITFVAVSHGVELLYQQLDDSAFDLRWMRYPLTYAVAFWIFVAWLPPSRLARSVRVAVLLPVLHAIVIAVAWPVWMSLSRFVSDPSTASALGTQFPIAQVVVIGIVVFAGFAMVVARARSGEWIHGLLTLALTELCLLGLWLPISCAAWPGGGADDWSVDHPIVADLVSRVAFTVVPPTVIALAFTAMALRRPRLLLRWRGGIVFALAITFVTALLLRLAASGRAMLLYSNLLPIMLAATVIAIAALMWFGITIWWRSLRTHHRFAARRRIHGVIADDGDHPVIGLEITSWLRGPRLVQRPFAITTAQGTIPVSGAHLVAALQPATTQLHTGECIAVLRPGDRVVLAGASDASGDPFRTSGSPLADALFVAPTEREHYGFTHVALAMWRPCVAYLLIATAIALPALAALAAD